MAAQLETAAVLDRAADIIETNGWCQDDWWDGIRGDSPQQRPDGARCCAVTALTVARRGEATQRGVLHLLNGNEPALMAFIDYLGLPSPLFITEWNDDPDRTAAEVVEALRDCARDLRGEPIAYLLTGQAGRS